MKMPELLTQPVTTDAALQRPISLRGLSPHHRAAALPPARLRSDNCSPLGEKI